MQKFIPKLMCAAVGASLSANALSIDVTVVDGSTTKSCTIESLSTEVQSNGTVRLTVGSPSGNSQSLTACLQSGGSSSSGSSSSGSSSSGSSSSGSSSSGSSSSGSSSSGSSSSGSSSSGSSSSGSSSSGSSSSGSSSGGSASCDYDASLLYNDAVVNISDWKKGAPLIRIPLGNDVFSYRFTTTDSDSMYGRITAGVYGGSESVGRKVWVSKCPNGAPLASAAYTYRGTQYNGCETKGTKNIAILPWYQYQKTYRCSLNTNETYYINVKHVLSDDDPNRCNRASSCQTSIEVGNNL